MDSTKVSIDYDLVVIGSGIAGLTAAINGASEGLKVVVLDASQHLGGQAATSSLIENFIGFPEGISGEELLARALQQCSKFGVEFLAPFEVNSVLKTEGYFQITNDMQESLTAKSVLLAMGVTYQTLKAKNIARYIGNGISYGSPSLSENYDGKSIVVVGGANSAGQAAYYLSTCKDCTVTLVIRGKAITDKMSDYLIQKLAKMPNVTILTETEVIEADGTDKLTLVVTSNAEIPTIRRCDRLFILIGAKPRTHWLESCKCMLDDKGFIITSISSAYPMGTSVSGMFAAGDVRLGSVKRVQAASGEGAVAIANIHQYLATL